MRVVNGSYWRSFATSTHTTTAIALSIAIAIAELGLQTARTSHQSATDAVRMHTAPPAAAVCSRAATRTAVTRHHTARISALNTCTALPGQAQVQEEVATHHHLRHL